MSACAHPFHLDSDDVEARVSRDVCPDCGGDGCGYCDGEGEITFTRR